MNLDVMKLDFKTLKPGDRIKCKKGDGECFTVGKVYTVGQPTSGAYVNVCCNLDSHGKATHLISTADAGYYEFELVKKLDVETLQEGDLIRCIDPFGQDCLTLGKTYRVGPRFADMPTIDCGKAGYTPHCLNSQHEQWELVRAAPRLEQPVVNEGSAKFKVGDRVRVITGKGSTVSPGRTGTIATRSVNYPNTYVPVSWDDGWKEGSWYIDDLELVNEPAARPFKMGDWIVNPLIRRARVVLAVLPQGQLRVTSRIDPKGSVVIHEARARKATDAEIVAAKKFNEEMSAKKFNEDMKRIDEAFGKATQPTVSNWFEPTAPKLSPGVRVTHKGELGTLLAVNGPVGWVKLDRDKFNYTFYLSSLKLAVLPDNTLCMFE